MALCEAMGPTFIGRTLWFLSHPKPSAQWLRVITGRWIRRMALRRATWVSISCRWRWICQPWRSRVMPHADAEERLSTVFLAPCMFTDLWCALSSEVAASAASEGGGGVCVSSRLTQRSFDQLPFGFPSSKGFAPVAAAARAQGVPRRGRPAGSTPVPAELAAGQGLLNFVSGPPPPPLSSVVRKADAVASPGESLAPRTCNTACMYWKRGRRQCRR